VVVAPQPAEESEPEEEPETPEEES
jgi:hypothetical protein